MVKNKELLEFNFNLDLFISSECCGTSQICPLSAAPWWLLREL